MSRTLRSLTTAIAAAALLGGCRSTPDSQDTALLPTAAEASPAETGWRGIANEVDEAKLERLAEAWSEGLARARRSHSRAIAAEEPLLDPDAALAHPAPSPGSYSCRVIKFGAAGRRAPAYQAFKPFFCHVGDGDAQLSITKQTGSQRPSGYLWQAENEGHRLVFLGSLALGGEDAPLPYGEDPARDMAGIFERVAAFRYRLVIPYPQDGATLEVIELVPASVQPAADR